MDNQNNKKNDNNNRQNYGIIIITTINCCCFCHVSVSAHAGYAIPGDFVYEIHGYGGEGGSKGSHH